MADNKLEIIIAAQNRVSETLNQVADDVRRMSDKAVPQVERTSRSFKNRLEGSVNSVANRLVNLKTIALSALAGWGVKQVADGFVDVGSRMDTMRISLDTITKGQGAEWFERLNEWAFKMPVNTEKAIQSFTMMRAMGLKPTIADMTVLVDTTSALGGSSDVMEGIARALGQMQTKGKASAEELMQLAERGVPAYEILREKLDLTSEQVANIGNEAIAGDVAVQALIKGMSERFGGQAAKIQNKWSGLMETMKSYWTEFRRMVMDSGVMTYMEGVLSTLVKKLDELRNTGDFERIARKTALTVISSISGIVSAVMTVPIAFSAVKNAVNEVLSAVSALGSAAVDVVAFMSALANPVWAVKTAIYGYRATFPTLARMKDAFESFGESTAQSAKNADIAGERYAEMAAKTGRALEKIKQKAMEVNRNMAAKFSDTAKNSTENIIEKTTTNSENTSNVTNYSERMVQSAKKITEEILKTAETDRELIREKITEYQTFYSSLQSKIAETAAIERRHVTELTALYKQQADVRKSTEELVAELQRKTQSPLEQYENRRASLDQQFTAAVQMSGQEQVKALEDYKRDVTELARQFEEGIKGQSSNIFSFQSESIAVSSKTVIEEAISDIERAGMVQTQTLSELTSEKQRQITQDQVWGASLKTTANDIAVEMEALTAVFDGLNNQIEALSKTVEINAEDQVTGVVDVIRGNLADLHDKTVTITTVHRVVNLGGSEQSPTAVTPTAPADSYAKGSMYVPKTALYELHKGEIVVKERMSEIIRKSPELSRIIAGDMPGRDMDRVLSVINSDMPTISIPAAQAPGMIADRKPGRVSAVPDMGRPNVKNTSSRTIVENININIPANGVPQTAQDWRRLARKYIVPQIENIRGQS